ncbi:MAG: hypothetical protein J1F64_05445 [Oscillospiraceae bacterium]|nr:hypothetical protein [Oscillospiraceae bacterium]
MRRGIFLILLVTMGVVIFYGVRYVRAPVNTETAYVTEYEESISGDAFLIKNESVNTASKSGMIYTYFSDGERVGKQRKIVTIYNASVDTDILKEINNIDKKIQSIKANASKTMQNSDMSDESIVINCINNVAEAVYNGDIGEIYSIKSEIKAIRQGNTEINKEEEDLKELQNKKAALESKIGTLKSDIYSKEAGVFINGTDGFEDILTPESMENMTVADFDALSRDIDRVIPTSVTGGDKICKTVDNNRWYIVMKTSADKLSESKAGDSVVLRFSFAPDSEVSAEIYLISGEENGEVLLFIKCEKYVEGIFSLRQCEVEVILNSYTGYRVPIYAIRVKDNQTGVMISKNTEDVFKPCRIIYTNEAEGFVIITSDDDTLGEIRQNDIIVVGEK